MRKKFADQRREDCYLDLPAQGLSESTILARIEKGAKASEQIYTNDKGNLAGGVYRKGEDHWNFISECIRISVISNPLHSSDFAYITHLEAEIVRWTLNLYKGDKDACGLCTSGGTESICLAMLAYRQQGLQERGVTKPNIVMSETAHPGHDKACHFFNIECRKIKMTSDFKADFEGMKRATDSNTICIIASAPEYGFGNYDPVNDIAAFALSTGIGCHVDCCLGSYINPFIEELGYKIPYQFDFSVPGVTSISADPHKYAGGPKGCSVIMFKNAELRNHQFFVCEDWTGGLYATTSMAGARAGAIIAGNWASMAKQGREGFRKQAKSILSTCANLRKAFENDPDIIVTSKTASPIFSWTSKKFNCIAMSDLMQKHYGWTIHKVQNPPSAHLTITTTTEGHWQDFVKAIKGCAQMMIKDPSLNVNPDKALYCIGDLIPDKNLIHTFIKVHSAAMLDTLGDPDEETEDEKTDHK